MRIKYIHEYKEYVYIVDFVNHDSKIATEIKPRELLEVGRAKSKILALERWCNNNNYKMNIITQDRILEMSTMVDMDRFDIKTQNKIKSLNETYKKIRNREAT